MPGFPAHPGPARIGAPFLATPGNLGNADTRVFVPGFLHQTPAPYADPVFAPPPSSRIIVPLGVPPTIFNDSGSGTITLSGSGVESFTTPPIQPLYGRAFTTAALGPSRTTFPPQVPPTIYTDSGSGTITLSGTGVETFVGPLPPKALRATDRQTVALVGPVSQTAGGLKLPVNVTYNDSGSGTITFSGSGVENFIGPLPPQALRARGSKQTPSLTEPVSQTVGGLKLSISYNDSGSGTLTLTGSGVEAYFPGVPFPPTPGVFWENDDERPNLSRLVSPVKPTGPQTFTDSRTGTLTLSGTVLHENNTLADALARGFPFHIDSGAWDRPDNGIDLFYDDPRTPRKR